MRIPQPCPSEHTTPRSDDQLLTAVTGGDLSSLGVLFDRYASDVRRFIGRLGVASSDVDDLTQATFLLVLRAAPNFRGGPNARTWLLGLAANTVRHHRRSMARIAARLASWAWELRESAPATPSDALDVQERNADAARALARLSPRKRETFVMVAMEGVPAEAAAEALGIPVGTVWTRLHHARRELRAQLERGGS